jgi:hypothetical protein
LVDNVDKKYTSPAMACRVQKSHADFLPDSTAIVGCILEFGVRQLLLKSGNNGMLNIKTENKSRKIWCMISFWKYNCAAHKMHSGKRDETKSRIFDACGMPGLDSRM